MNRIHPSAVVGANVRLGDDNTIGPFVVLSGNVEIGDRNWIGSGVKIGPPPEVRSVLHGADWLDSAEGPGVRIGSRNVIREDVKVHGGWKTTTSLGDGLFVMNGCYIAHDCELEDGITLAAGVSLAGHVKIGIGASLGLSATVHQQRVIGALAMIGMSSVVTHDIPPFVKAFGNPCRIRGVNSVGMLRASIAEDEIAEITRLVDLDDFPTTALPIGNLTSRIDWFLGKCTQ